MYDKGNTDGSEGRSAVPGRDTQERQAIDEPDPRKRYLQDDEAAVERCRAARAPLAALLPRDDHHRFAGTGRAARRHAAPRRALRPAHRPALRPARPKDHAEYCRTDFDLT